MKIQAFTIVIECPCNRVPIYSGQCAYRDDTVAGWMGYQIWREFFAEHRAVISLATVEVEESTANASSLSDIQILWAQSQAGEPLNSTH